MILMIFINIQGNDGSIRDACFTDVELSSSDIRGATLASLPFKMFWIQQCSWME